MILTCLTGITGHCRPRAVRGLCALTPVFRGLGATTPLPAGTAAVTIQRYVRQSPSSGTKSFGIMMGGGGECAPSPTHGVRALREALVAAEICRAHAARPPLTRARRGWLPRARAVRQFPGDRGS